LIDVPGAIESPGQIRVIQEFERGQS
jgi:hypothetical protein